MDGSIDISLKYNEEEFVILRIYLNLNTTINTIKIDSFSVTLTSALEDFNPALQRYQLEQFDPYQEIN